MKKHDEGYVLVLVMVVMLVLCAIAVGVLSIALNNFQNQQATIDRTKAQYAAEGEIEKVIAVLENGLEDETTLTLSEETTLSFVKKSGKEDTNEGTLTIVVKTDSVIITCELSTTGITDVTDNPGNSVRTYTIYTDETTVTHKYLSYEITSTGGGT